MIRGSLALALAAGCLASGSVPAQQLPPGTLDCVAAVGRLDPQAAAAESAPLLGDACPELAEAIQAGAWGRALAFAEAQNLSTDGFLALVDLVQRYDDPAAAGAPISIAELAGIAAGLRPFEPLPELSFWQRVANWVQEKLGAGTGGASDRFLEWLRGLGLPESWVRPIVYATAIVIVAVVLLILVNELRHGGVFARRAVGRRIVDRYADESLRLRTVTFDDLRKFPLREQPIVLFRLVVERLRAHNARPAFESLTHRELVAANVMLGSEHVSALASVAHAAERATFGDWAPAQQDLDPILHDGRVLLSALDGEPGS